LLKRPARLIAEHPLGFARAERHVVVQRANTVARQQRFASADRGPALHPACGKVEDGVRYVLDPVGHTEPREQGVKHVAQTGGLVIGNVKGFAGPHLAAGGGQLHGVDHVAHVGQINLGRARARQRQSTAALAQEPQNAR
jgi:hypothetical protein